MAKEHTDLIRGTQDVGILRFSLPIPPSVNDMYYNQRNGVRRKTAIAENYERESKALINAVVEDNLWVKPKVNVWMYIDMVYYFPNRVRRDSHNCLKILMDVLEGRIYINDYTALPRIMSVEYDKHNPRVEITVHAQTAELREMYTNDIMSLS